MFVAIGLAAALTCAAVLFFFDPARSGFYPRCFFHATTGLDCPGCGGLRATHQLLHGNVRAAFALNPLLVCSLPIVGWLGLRYLVRITNGRALPNPFQSAACLWGMAAAVIAFGIFRNVPMRSWLGW